MCKVDGCSLPVLARELCSKHYWRWRRYGTTTGLRDRIGDFWNVVAIGEPNECWEWQRGRNQHGYGVITIAYKKWSAHRYAWTLTHGPIPDGAFICHHCDNRACVNPDHLYVGTHQSNMADMVSRERHSMGVRSSRSKLTEEQVREIRRLRADGVRIVEVAAQFNVSITTVSQIVHGTRWKHIT